MRAVRFGQGCACSLFVLTMPASNPPIRAHLGKPFRTMKDAALSHQVLTLRCNLCRRRVTYLASDLVEIVGHDWPLHIPRLHVIRMAGNTCRSRSGTHELKILAAFRFVALAASYKRGKQLCSEIEPCAEKSDPSPPPTGKGDLRRQCALSFCSAGHPISGRPPTRGSVHCACVRSTLFRCVAHWSYVTNAFAPEVLAFHSV